MILAIKLHWQLLLCAVVRWVSDSWPGVEDKTRFVEWRVKRDSTAAATAGHLSPFICLQHLGPLSTFYYHLADHLFGSLGKSPLCHLLYPVAAFFVALLNSQTVSVDRFVAAKCWLPAVCWLQAIFTVRPAIIKVGKCKLHCSWPLSQWSVRRTPAG